MRQTREAAISTVQSKHVLLKHNYFGLVLEFTFLLMYFSTLQSSSILRYTTLPYWKKGAATSMPDDLGHRKCLLLDLCRQNDMQTAWWIDLGRTAEFMGAPLQLSNLTTFRCKTSGSQSSKCYADSLPPSRHHMTVTWLPHHMTVIWRFQLPQQQNLHNLHNININEGVCPCPHIYFFWGEVCVIIAANMHFFHWSFCVMKWRKWRRWYGTWQF